MAAYVLTNNAYSTLSGTLAIGATSLSVQAGHGARFPVIAGADWTYATLQDSANNIEIVKVTGRSTDTLTIVRAQEGTAARAWASGDVIECRFTAATVVSVDGAQTLTNKTITGDSTIITGTSKATPVDADYLPLADSAATDFTKKLTWANLKATLGSTFAALAGAVGQVFSAASIELGHATDTTLTRVSAGVMAVEGKTVAMLSAAQTFTATQTPDNGTAAISTTSSYVFDGADQVREITLTNAITVTFGSPTGIVEHAMYVFKLKAGDTAARAFAWNAAYKFPAATPPLAAGSVTTGGKDIIVFIGGPGNTLEYQGHQADVR